MENDQEWWDDTPMQEKHPMEYLNEIRVSINPDEYDRWRKQILDDEH